MLKLKFIKNIICLSCLFFAAHLTVSTNVLAQAIQSSPITQEFTETLNKPSNWADSVMKKMNKRERIAQLFMVPLQARQSFSGQDSALQAVKKYKPGGILVEKGSPDVSVALLNQAQKLLRIPALTAMNAEWGAAAQLDSILPFPFEMTLGAIQDNQLIYNVGYLMAAQCKRLGIAVNFAPVLDTASSDAAISFRCFGEDKENVTQKGLMMIKGLQDGGIISAAKYFGGYAETPSKIITLEALDIDPFKKAIEQELIGIKVGNLGMSVPASDSSYAKLPASLADTLVTGLLREELRFKGLIFTDVLDMQPVIEASGVREAVVKAFNAGNDVMQFSGDLAEAIEAVEYALKKKKIDKHEMNRRVRRVLTAKYALGLSHPQPVYQYNITTDLNSAEAYDLNMRLAEASATALIRPSAPAVTAADKSLAVVSIGTSNFTQFQTYIDAHTPVAAFTLPADASQETIKTTIEALKSYHKVIIGLHDVREYPKNTLYYSKEVLDFINQTVEDKSVYMCIMANPYAAASIPNMDKLKGLWIHYQDNKFTETAAARVVLGQINPEGVLPVSIDDRFKAGTAY